MTMLIDDYLTAVAFPEIEKNGCLAFFQRYPYAFQNLSKEMDDIKKKLKSFIKKQVVYI